MRSLIVLVLVGLAAQLVDGSLGMAYGATSTSLLLLAGLSPVMASASVHLAEVGTTFASGVAHWRFGNVDRRVVLLLGVPGAIGAFAGATALANLSTAAARPVMAVVLLLIGVHLLVRRPRRRSDDHRPLPLRFLAPLGLVAGFVDATGGGGWGPLSAPALLVSGRLDPRRVIGSVATAEFLVTVSASVGFLLALGRSGLALDVVAALLVGGMVAAPFAAWLVRRVPVEALFPAVGGLLVLTNLAPVLTTLGVGGPARAVLLAAAVVAWVVAVVVAVLRRQRIRPRAEGSDAPEVGSIL